MGIREDRPRRGAELMAALFFEALVQAGPAILAARFPLELGDIQGTAPDATLAVRPASLFDVV
jgi:hypothetical protein